MGSASGLPGVEVERVAYSELIKDYERIRDYMRQFYVYGFKRRDQYDAKSARSYDNERRRIESWLGEYMSFRQDSAGKQVFLSMDSRKIRHNPLYKSFQAKSFTDKDITLHFYLLDILADGQALTTRQVVERIDRDYLSAFDGGISLDTSTVRKKLKEYEALGLLSSEKQGKETFYRLAGDGVELRSWLDALAFYSEEAPLGVLGFLLLDQLNVAEQPFRFKHHYILHALDSEILCTLLMAIGEHSRLGLVTRNTRRSGVRQIQVCPMKIYVSTQTGRQYLLGYQYDVRHFVFQRVDRIVEARPGPKDPQYGDYAVQYETFKRHLWGVSTGSGRGLEHIEMTVRAGQDEPHIPARLMREKRYGQVEQLDETTWRFTADVYDAAELLPWLRTFIGRIMDLTCSNPAVVQRFYADLEEMTALYGGDGDAVP